MCCCVNDKTSLGTARFSSNSGPCTVVHEPCQDYLSPTVLSKIFCTVPAWGSTMFSFTDTALTPEKELPAKTFNSLSESTLIKSHLTGRGFSLDLVNVHASIWKPLTSRSLFPVTNKVFVSTKYRCIYEISDFSNGNICYLHLQFINKWFSLSVTYQQEAGMLPCPHQPWAFPRDLWHLGAFHTPSGKTCKVQRQAHL